MNGLSLFIEKGFKIEKQSKTIDGQKKVNYLIDSPEFGKFEVDGAIYSIAYS